MVRNGEMSPQHEDPFKSLAPGSTLVPTNASVNAPAAFISRSRYKRTEVNPHSSDVSNTHHTSRRRISLPTSGFRTDKATAEERNRFGNVSYSRRRLPKSAVAPLLPLTCETHVQTHDCGPLIVLSTAETKPANQKGPAVSVGSKIAQSKGRAKSRKKHRARKGNSATSVRAKRGSLICEVEAASEVGSNLRLLIEEFACDLSTTKPSTPAKKQSKELLPSHPAPNSRRHRKNSAGQKSNQWLPRKMIANPKPHHLPLSDYIPPHKRRTAFRTDAPGSTQVQVVSTQLSVNEPRTQASQNGHVDGDLAEGAFLSNSIWAAPESRAPVPRPSVALSSHVRNGQRVDRVDSHGSHGVARTDAKPSPGVGSSAEAMTPPLPVSNPAINRQTQQDTVTPASTKATAGDTLLDPEARPSASHAAPGSPSDARKTGNTYETPGVESRRNTKWARPPKIVPKTDDNAWGSDTEHAAASETYDDPEHAVRNLVDWEGNWLPAPVEWEGRKGFRDRDFHAGIERWITDAKACEGALDLDDDFTAVLNGEVAPRFWIPVKIDDQSPQEYWKHHLRYWSVPPPSSARVAGEDKPWWMPPDEKPWWVRYASVTSNLLTPLAVPEAKLDPSDENIRNALKDAGSNAASMEHMRKAALTERQKKRIRRAERENRALNSTPYVPHPSNSCRPKVNLFLRTAFPFDIPQIRDIYNYHVDNTIHTPEMQSRTVSQIRDRIADIAENKLPFIVAIEKNTRGVGGARGAPSLGMEKVIGFACADDYHDMSGMYRYTAEMEIFVHPDYFMKGVATCLMDRLLFILDPNYELREGYEWKSESFQHAGGLRVIGSVLCHVPYDAENANRITWTTRWMEQAKWKKVGDVPNIGIKRNRSVSMAIFQYVTGSRIDPVSAL